MKNPVSEYLKIQEERHAMEREFDRRTKELQDNCPHEKLTGWLEDYEVKVKMCRRCHKTVVVEPDPKRWMGCL